MWIIDTDGERVVGRDRWRTGGAYAPQKITFRRRRPLADSCLLWPDLEWQKDSEKLDWQYIFFSVCCPDGYKLSIGNCPIWKPNIGSEKCLRMAGEGDNIYDIGVTVAFLTLVWKDASKIPRVNDFSHPCLLFLQTRSLFWSSWLWSFRLSLPRLWICPMVSKPWH